MVQPLRPKLRHKRVVFLATMIVLLLVWWNSDSEYSLFGESVGLPTIAGPEDPELLAELQGTLSVIPGFLSYLRGQRIDQVQLSSGAECKSEIPEGDIVAFDGPDEEGLCVYLLDSTAPHGLSLMSFKVGSVEPHRAIASNDEVRRSLVKFSSISLSRRGGHVLVDLGRETTAGVRRVCEYWRVGTGVIEVLSEDHYPMMPKWLGSQPMYVFQRLEGDASVAVSIVRGNVDTGEEVVLHATSSFRWGGWGSFLVDKSTSLVLIEQDGNCLAYSGVDLQVEDSFTLPGALSNRAGPCLVGVLSPSRILYVAHPTAGKEMPPYGWGRTFPPSPAAIKVLDTSTGEFATVVDSFAYSQVAYSEYEF